MDDICRLCCSTKFVNNNIFDEENALYLKMSLYLPIKVFKNDRLPQRVCDKCSCKVNDFYQFCNETIEVQNRLRSLLHASGFPVDELVDLTLIKDSSSPPPASIVHCEQATQTELPENMSLHLEVDITKVKDEPKPFLSPIKEENIYNDNFEDRSSDSSENMSLITLKQLKTSKSRDVNGKANNKQGRKKHKLKEWEQLMSTLPEGTAITVINNKDNLNDKKTKGKDLDMPMQIKKPKSEPNEEDIFHCCICLIQCYSRNEMLQHYKQHGNESTLPFEAPVPPDTPDTDQEQLRCTRCGKKVDRLSWVSHWQRHYERDRRPYRCSLCESTFRDHAQILKHGLTHKYGAGAGAGAGAECAAGEAEPLLKRFLCDICPQGFVQMRYLLSHRTRAHPEALSRALAMRCGVCEREFAHLNSLRRHLRAHTGERNFLCNVCGKSLSSREHLKFHIRIHTGYKPNVCNTCGKGFVKKCNLLLHERVHSGEKPHVCSHCGKAFSQRSTLVIHERYHSGARPYVCGLCGRGFVAKGLLTMHLKTTCI